MPRSTGLRAEIALHLVFLVGAALLMGGVLLLRLGEREMVDQRAEMLTTTLRLLVEAGVEGDGAGSVETRLEQIAERTARIPGLASLEIWRIGGGVPVRPQGFQPLPGTPAPPVSVASGYILDDFITQVIYPTLWLPGQTSRGSGVWILAPVRLSGRPVATVRAYFTLDPVVNRLQQGQRLVVLYALLYGAVVLACGLALLQRHVVRPARRLLESTRRVGAGDLNASVPERGPREIAELGVSFNQMVTALRKSRSVTEEHIDSLRSANRQLQETRDELVQSAKMATVGHLAAGMAHEIGNPLAAIVGYLEILKGDLGDSSARDLAARASAEATRIQRLVEDLLDYAAPGDRQAETFDPAGVVAEAVSVIGGQGLLDAFKLHNGLPSDLPAVTMVRHQLLQVLINLLLNARDASEAGAEIILEGGYGDKGVWITVADEGCGIDPENRQHVFDPFYTTKAPGRGRGLGLAVCHQVMTAAGGGIRVDARPHRGTVFTLWLPPSGV